MATYYYMYDLNTKYNPNNTYLDMKILSVPAPNTNAVYVTGYDSSITTGNYTVYAYTSAVTSNSAITLMNASNLPIQVFMVGGGGSGGCDQAGGGGGGGVVQTIINFTGSDTINLTIGAGGVAVSGYGVTGGNTSVTFNTLTSYNKVAYGGGGGASYTYNANLNSSGTAISSANIGSGGGSTGYTTASYPAGTTTSGQGNNGGNGVSGTGSGGGGGGAGAVGGSGTSTNAGNGGDGVQLNTTLLTSFAGATIGGKAINTLWWGGGGGSGGCLGNIYAGNGGKGGGGGGSSNTYTGGTGDTNGYNSGTAGGTGTNQKGGNGGANTGGGGGGSSQGAGILGGNGGSGIIFIAIPTATLSSVVPLVTSNLVINLDSTVGISGNTWADSTINAYNYNCYDSAFNIINFTTATVSGIQVVSLNGTGYIWRNNASGFGSNFLSSFTYEYWVYPKSTANATLIYEYGQNGFGGWSDDQMGTNSQGYFTSYVYNGGSIVNTSGGAYSINNWYQVVNVYDNTAKVLYQYVNGTLKASVSITKSYPGTVWLLLGGNGGGGQYMNGAGNFNGYIGSFRGYNISLTGSQIMQNYNAVCLRYGLPVISLDGSTSGRAAPSAAFIKSMTGTNTNGVYWINLPTVGPTQVYCIMDSAVDGGGWMMAMKATRGTTFNYSSTYWTDPATTLNPTDTTRNDGDAKFNTMNYYPATDILGLFPDITTVGGSLSLSTYGCWCWEEKGFYKGGTTVTSPITYTQRGSVTQPIVLTTFFSTVSRYFIQDAKTWSGWATGIFSSQKDIRFYGFNWTDNQNTRWGFGWNENGGGLFPNGVMGSDDVNGGIGITYNSYSAGDVIGCCQDGNGINRSARVEIYIR